MVYGLPKFCKSTLSLDFAKYLAVNNGKVLYCAVEEGFGNALKEKIERLNASIPNLYITDRIPAVLSPYQFVFIDSVSKAGMDVSDLEELRKQYPGVSFIFIYHTTKEGDFQKISNENKFFSITENSPLLLQRVVSKMKLENSINSFVVIILAYFHFGKP